MAAHHHRTIADPSTATQQETTGDRTKEPDQGRATPACLHWTRIRPEEDIQEQCTKLHQPTNTGKFPECLHPPQAHPQGLQNPPQMSDPKETKVKHRNRFQGISGGTEEGFTTMFRDHLHFVALQVKEEINSTLTEIHDTTNTVSVTELLTHQGFQAATE